MIDRQKIGEFAMTAIDAIAEDFEQAYPGEELQTGELMLVIEVQRPDSNMTNVLYYSTEQRTWANYGLIKAAMEAAEGMHGD